MTRELTETRIRPAVPARPRSFTEQLIEPLSLLRGEMDRLFDDFPFRLPARFAADATIAMPALEMKETKKAYKIAAEVPGLEAADIQVTVEDDVLRIAGEKQTERDEEEGGYSYSERSYGSFERRVRLPASANEAKIQAKCRNGVLTVTIPKDGKAEERVRKIAVG